MKITRAEYNRAKAFKIYQMQSSQYKETLQHIIEMLRGRDNLFASFAQFGILEAEDPAWPLSKFSDTESFDNYEQVDTWRKAQALAFIGFYKSE